MQICSAKHVLFIVAILFLFFSSSAQVRDAVADTSAFSYHRAIIQAEKLVLQNRHQAALQLYDSVFNCTRIKFARDLFNCFQVACLTDNKALQKKYFLASVTYGINNRTFKASRVAADWVLKNSAYVKQHYDTARLQHWQSLNLPIRSMFSGMRFSDNLAHVRGREIANSKSDQSAIVISIKKHDTMYAAMVDAFAYSIEYYVNTYGFPSEQSLGLLDHDADAYEVEYYKMKSLNTNQQSLLLFPFFHQQYMFHKLYKPMVAAVGNGALHPRDFAAIADYSCNSTSNHSPEADRRVVRLLRHKTTDTVKWQNYNMHFSPDTYSTDICEVNARRALIALPTVEHDTAIEAYAKEYGMVLRLNFFEQ
ncbi:MAG: hypothetical protein RL660_1334 [Bacteroidota bacterium]|jgi:hypothetical protein